MHQQQYGNLDGPLMLFIHGGGVSGWMWDEQIRHFSPHYHCVVPDLPEHGQSLGDAPFSIRASAEYLLQRIEAIGAGKTVIIIGFSLGAQIAVQMVSMRPDLIDYAIINSALVIPMPSMKRWIPLSVRLTFPLIRNRSFSKLQAKQLYLSSNHLNNYYEESCRMKPDSLVRILEENMSFELPAGFHKAQSKLLVTVGEKEKSVMQKSVALLVRGNTGCIGVVIPDIGHGVSLAKPAYFNQMIERWLDNGQVPHDSQLIT
ncbi:alpha/beta fold hydrolase [Paenibacillus radicis (ex Gao et al. 2016)]|uniref:Hydrolase n=1 Tax=Paenibacillus radicis (ex Gao et al. 2016) TaxID=1737354 RepID=A0A917LW83_9BACL|nr:alpha/beta hydrolase [Paenibacillus radicis (ex Gao et al. 2016)]GGG61134.1 hydrolase [Paenibacillus radicis (ex Gao et al. 2016)]